MATTSPKKSDGWGVLLGAAIAVLVLWGIWFYVTKKQWGADNGNNLEAFGQIGDTFGSLNTLFSGLAFAGVLFTLYRQHEDAKQAERRHKTDAEEADTRHQTQTEMQRDSARVVMLASMLDYQVASLQKLDERAGAIRKLAGYRGHFNDQMTKEAIFSHATYHKGEIGVEFYTLATQMMGNLIGWKVAYTFEQMDVFIDGELKYIHNKRTELQANIRSIIDEAEMLTQKAPAA